LIKSIYGIANCSHVLIHTGLRSIRPTFLVDPPRLISGANRPGKWRGSTRRCTRSFRPTRM